MNNEVAEANHAKFLAHLDQSNAGVYRVAMWLHSLGVPVSIPVAPRVAARSDWKDGADNGDLYIQQRIEVKQLSVQFTSQADWPFRDKFIVCAKHAFDRATPKPYAYVILSKDGNYAATVKTSSSARWRVEKRTDSRYEGVAQDLYFADLADVSFSRIA